MAVKYIIYISFSFIIFAHIASSNIVLECISLLYCNGNAPVCGSNGTHCWYSKSDCERAKFNCLQLYKKDFDKIDLNYCDDSTIGEIKSCCVKKKCSSKNDHVCGKSVFKSLDKKCKWFKNRCEMENFNCGNKTVFVEADKKLCNFDYNSRDEQDCLYSKNTNPDLPPQWDSDKR